MNTIKTIIIEDQINNLKLLEHFIDKYCPEIELIASCTSKTEAVKAIQKLKPQLLFLDVILEDHTAFDILEEVDYTNFNIIFVTAFEEYALKAFQYNAIDYLLKPIQIDDLIVAVKKIALQNEKNQFIQPQQVQALSELIQSKSPKYITI